MAEERSERLGHREDELPAGKVEEYFVGEMLRKEEGAFLATGWAEVKSLTGERSEVVMATLWIGTADSVDSLQIVPAGGEPLADLLDPLEAVYSVRFGVLLLVVLAEVGKVAE